MRVRESPTYVPMGMEKEILLRLPRSLKAESRHLQKQIRAAWDSRIRLGPLLTTCALLGAAAVVEQLGSTRPARSQRPSPQKSPDEAIEQWRRRPLKSEFKRIYDDAYRGLPGPGVSEFIRHCVEVGIPIARRTFLTS